MYCNYHKDDEAILIIKKFNPLQEKSTLNDFSDKTINNYCSYIFYGMHYALTTPLHKGLQRLGLLKSKWGEIYIETANRHSEVVSAALAKCSKSKSSKAFGCFGLVSTRPNTTKPAPSIQESSSSRVRRPRCSARSESINQPSP